MLKGQSQVVQGSLAELPFHQGLFERGLCLGNGLSHLHRQQLKAFVAHWSRISKPNAKLLVQMVNWDLWLSTKKEFPLFKRGDWALLRSYSGGVHRVRFGVQVRHKGNVLYKDFQFLYPIKKEELKKLFLEFEFRLTSEWQDFQKKSLLDQSPAWLLEFTKH